VVARLEEAIQQAAVRFKQGSCTLSYPIEFVERNHAQSLRGMCRDHAEQIVESPHPYSQLRFSQYPTAAQTAQSVSLCKTAGRYELAAEMKSGRRATEQSLQV